MNASFDAIKSHFIKRVSNHIVLITLLVLIATRFDNNIEIGNHRVKCNENKTYFTFVQSFLST